MNKKPVPGIRFKENGDAEIALWSPLVKKAAIIINDDMTLDLNQSDFGYWLLVTDQLKPGDHYQFILDGDKQLPDPASLMQSQGVHGSSKSFDLNQFNWSDAQWSNPPLADYIIYELHIGTFTPDGTFSGIAGQLDYLIDLGITAIEIMPVAQFPGKRNWGYDGVFPYAVQNSYGGADGLMELVNTCHQKGMAIILDVVYNHFGPEGNYFNEYAPYFTEKYHTPWGNAINFDDEWSDEVRHFFIENVLMWFRDFHVDALRMDAVHAIKDLGAKHILREIKEQVNQLMEETGKTHHLIVELDLNDAKFIDPPEKQGYGMDAQWIDEFHHALRVTAGGDRSGYYSDFNGIADLAKSYNSAYVYDGVYSHHRLKTFGNKATDNPGNQFIVFSQNHDQVGNRMLGERSSELFNFEMQKLMVGAVMMSPFIPMLFMGEEWSSPSPFLYFVSHSDPELVEAVRKGRKEEFAAFHAEGEAPDPQAEDTFERSKLDWALIKTEPYQKMLDYYKTVIALRKQLPALSDLNRKNAKTTVNQEKQTLLLQRWDDHQTVAILMNFSDKVQNIEFTDMQQWQKVLDSAEVKWNGPGATKQNIQPQSIIIYKNDHV